MSIIVAFQQEPALFYTVVIIFSLLVGSFLNVVIHRIPVMMKREAKDDNHSIEQRRLLLKSNNDGHSDELVG